jgi:hypothetical protein
LNEFVVGAIKTPRFKNLWFAASAIPETCQGRSGKLLAFAADPHHGNAVTKRAAFNNCQPSVMLIDYEIVHH